MRTRVPSLRLTVLAGRPGRAGLKEQRAQRERLPARHAAAAAKANAAHDDMKLLPSFFSPLVVRHARMRTRCAFWSQSPACAEA